MVQLVHNIFALNVGQSIVSSVQQQHLLSKPFATAFLNWPQGNAKLHCPKTDRVASDHCFPLIGSLSYY